MKHIKNIFSRKSSIWLALELILVTIACWWAFDPLLVTSYVTHMPLGYDTDRLVQLNVASNIPVKEAFQNTNLFRDEETQLVEKLEEMEDVEMAYLAYDNPIGNGSMNLGHYFSTKLREDSIYAHVYGFMPDSKMFEVYGIQSLTPEVPTSELSHDCAWEKSIIITRSLAMYLFGTIDVAGRTITSYTTFYNEKIWDYQKGNVDYKVRAVVEDIKSYISDRDYTNVFICKGSPSVNIPIIVRLREGINADKFIQSHQQQVDHELVTKHCYVRNMKSLKELNQQEFEHTYGRSTRRFMLIAAFFALNLAFGVFGTLLMYTRQRREEAGVRRAFGATRWSVFWNFISEAWLLTTISVVAGCAIYFQFATTHGLFSHFLSTWGASHYWFDDFGTHFLVVSVIVYLVLLCAVLIATAIPAWRICRSEITVALKDE